MTFQAVPEPNFVEENRQGRPTSKTDFKDAVRWCQLKHANGKSIEFDVVPVHQLANDAAYKPAWVR
jgi:hypothetical protein